jgi:hypothetical protein
MRDNISYSEKWADTSLCFWIMESRDAKTSVGGMLKEL